MSCKDSWAGKKDRRRTHPVGDAEAVGGDGERRVAKRFAALAPASSWPPRFMAAMRDVPHRLHAAKARTGGRLSWFARWLSSARKFEVSKHGLRDGFSHMREWLANFHMTKTASQAGRREFCVCGCRSFPVVVGRGLAWKSTLSRASSQLNIRPLFVRIWFVSDSLAIRATSR